MSEVYSKEDLKELSHDDLVELYVGLRADHAARTEELDALWRYADWEAMSLIESHAGPGDDQYSPVLYHRIMADLHEIWPRYLAARSMRRCRTRRSIGADAWYGEDIATEAEGDKSDA